MPIGRKVDRLHEPGRSIETKGREGIADLPEPGRLIVAGGGERLAIGREGNNIHRTIVTEALGVPAGSIHQYRDAVRFSGGEKLSIGRIGDGVRLPESVVDDRNVLAVRKSPDPDLVRGITASRSQLLVVRRESDAENEFVTTHRAKKRPVRDLPKFDVPIHASGSKRLPVMRERHRGHLVGMTDGRRNRSQEQAIRDAPDFDRLIVAR